MYLLDFYQDEEIIEVGLFPSIEEGRKFVKQIPGYEMKEEEGFLYEYFYPESLPEYMELSFSGNLFPMTKYMFLETSRVDIVWKSLPDFSKTGNGIVDGATRVDAYSVDNKEVSQYIRKREEQYVKVKEILTLKDIEVERSFFGSEDGEAVVYRKKGTKDWHFLLHMDPGFVEEENMEAFVEEMLTV
ncbi:hypothetical protein [Fusobacterium necrophorum]|uniref:DUF4367 domain-containing protein n=1 Tax=Fusobacterium necrophorum DJ-2 TaxID=1441737 RepID=A0AB73C588_9FUSO|nr:hypothetical protein [Fusobacterium necrophorum]AYV95182.1 hypothetical protein BWX37_05960 [Fusobacterium necrophorum subsp. funduliforme]KDE60769.1 hypothetical protein FUSO4_12825 [Fusobacterium necrophorum DJ-1]KDE73194.1 hypothetical protein FUSO8_02240 [Fusobacterium necrophorum DJ-2]KYL01522.1 hypothetical protein A2J05_03220 [Fusobacterium necrophorum subsp. funduliforme]KYL03155.1 hypothetical protein A2J06_01960 [Fusobacterium necrophorum subsp. funduliforme]